MVALKFLALAVEVQILIEQLNIKDMTYNEKVTRETALRLEVIDYCTEIL